MAVLPYNHISLYFMKRDFLVKKGHVIFNEKKYLKFLILTML